MPIIEVRGVEAGYGGRPVISGVSLALSAGEVISLIGHNGAGKSTLLKVMFGLLQPQGGEILLDGRLVNGILPVDMARAGIAMVPEGRGVFPDLSVEDNFRLGMVAVNVPQAERRDRIGEVLDLLPEIKLFILRPAGTLSGGQQQMVSIARAMLSRPRCLLLDEPSIGLAPKLFQDLIAPIRRLQQARNLGILLVEQNIKEAFKVSDRVVVMRSGAVIRESTPAELTDHRKLMELY